MVFIKRWVIEGHIYYQYVKGYRKGRKVEVRAISNLFKYSSLQDALNGARRMAKEERIRRLEAAVTKRRQGDGLC